MKREDVKARIPNITDEAMTWLLDTTGAELTREKNRAADLQKQLDDATGQLATVQEKLKAFDGANGDRVQWTKQGAVSGAALRFLQASAVSRRKNRLSARGRRLPAMTCPRVAVPCFCCAG